MKKTLLAFLVAATATSANAAVTVYDSEGISIDVTGSAEVQLYKPYNASDGGSDPDLDIRIDDGDVGAGAQLQLNEEFYALGAFGFAFEDSDMTNDELYVGIGSEHWGVLTAGRQYLLSDDIGIGKDYEFGTGGVDFVQTQGDEVYKYVWDSADRYGDFGFYFGTSGMLSNDGGTYLPNTGQEVESGDIIGELRSGNTEIYDARVGMRYKGLDARIYYYTADNAVTAGLFRFGSIGGNPIAVDVDAYTVEVEYQLTDAIGLAGSWSDLSYENPGNSSEEQNANVYQIAADYQWNNTNFAAGFNFWDDTRNTVGGNNDEIDAQTYYVNVTQRIHRFAKVYAEIGIADEDGESEPQDDVAYLVGMEVGF